MGNADQLTGAAPSGRSAAKPAGHAVRRTVLYGLGTLSMLFISMATSLFLWIGLPWAFLGWSPTLVTSGSMAPLVTPGDVVMVHPVNPRELTPNTVVLFVRDGGERILHRIVEQMPDGTYRTQGDANQVPDSEFLHASQIRGAAVLAVPWVGRPSLWLQQRRYVLLGAGAVGLLVVLALAPRSFDPAYDPWSSGRRINPAEVLLGRAGGDPADRRGSAGGRLLPDKLQGMVLDRLAAQSTAAHLRTAQLLAGLS